MSKNILELLKDKIKAYEKDKDNSVRVPIPMILSKFSYAHGLIIAICGTYMVYSEVDKNKSYSRHNDCQLVFKHLVKHRQ